MRAPALLSRIRSTLPDMLRKQANYARWLLFSSERHSISYRPSRAAEMSIAAVLGAVTDLPIAETGRVVRELAADRALTQRLSSVKLDHGRALAHDRAEGLGKHLFYASALTLLRPAAICEVGTYLGYGASILSAVANTYGGRVTTLDHRKYEPNFLSGDSITRVELDCLASDASDWLAALGFDFVIWDAVRHPQAETRLFDALMAARTPYLCANWHSSGALFECAARNGYRYLPVPVESTDHWHPGSLLGFAFRR